MIPKAVVAAVALDTDRFVRAIRLRALGQDVSQTIRP